MILKVGREGPENIVMTLQSCVHHAHHVFNLSKAPNKAG